VKGKISVVVRLIHSHSMASHMHLLFMATCCLGSAAVVFAIRTKAKKPDLTLEDYSTISDDPREIADKPAVDDAHPEASQNDQRLTISAVSHAGPRVVRVEENSPISDVHAGTVETANGVQRISMESTSPTHETHWNTSFLDAIDRERQDCSAQRYDVWEEEERYTVLKCDKVDNLENVVYISGRPYGRSSGDEEGPRLMILFDGKKFRLGKIDWQSSRYLKCVMTPDSQVCQDFIQSWGYTAMWATNSSTTLQNSKSIPTGNDLKVCCQGHSTSTASNTLGPIVDFSGISSMAK